MPEDQNLPLEIVETSSDPTAKKPAPSRRLGLWRLYRVPLVFLLIFIGGVIGLYFQPPGMQRFFETTGLQPGGGSDAPFALPVGIPEDVVATLQPSDVVGLARLMPEGDIATVAPPFGAGDARLSDIVVSVGDRVEAGQTVAVLDNLAQLEAALAAARASVAVSEAALEQTRASVETSVEEARASLEQAEAAAEVARLDLERTQSLRDRGVATQAALDQAQSTYDQADRGVALAAATLSRFTRDDPGQQPDVIVAQRNLDAAEADLARAEGDLNNARVIAPITGTILDIDNRPGERPASEGIMKIGAVDQMMAEVEVFQNRIVDVALGQPVEVVADALNRTLYGEVVEIGLIVERQNVVSDDTAANTDARVVKVLVALDEASSAQARSFSNLEVIARIDTRGAIE